MNLRLSTYHLRLLTLDGKNLSAMQPNVEIKIPAGGKRILTFEVALNKSKANYIDRENVFLTGNWFPRPDGLAEYTLSVTLPKGFLAVSEADTVDVQNNEKTDTFNFQFNHPVDGLSLAASRNYILAEDNYKDVRIEAYFFAEDAHLAGEYLAYAKKYMAMYEKMLTKYPYKRFVIAENLFPTGYSMPTYTLLGKAVVRLPFITRTSLGHEILHQWFGSSVYTGDSGGNWAEGITNYLADHQHEDLEGKGAAYRKQILLNYDAYVNESNKIPLAQFLQRRNKAQSAIGYGKSAMVFHSLRKKIGESAFFNVLRDFLNTHRFRKATWKDIQASFEKNSRNDLADYFSQSLQRDDIPRLSVEDSELIVDQGRLMLNFTLVQNPPAYHLKVPVAIYTSNKKTTRYVDVKNERESIRLQLDEPPTRVTIDEDYDLMRELDSAEIPAALAKIMGKDKILVVSPTENLEKYQPVIRALGLENVTFQTPETVTFNQIKQHSVILAGFQLLTTSMLFGRQPVYEDGVRLHVHHHPYNPKEAILLLHVKDIEEARAVQRKLSHYGKYKELVFDGGKIVRKEKAETPSGIPVFIRPVAKMLKLDKIATLADVLPELLKRRIIYVGEQHDKYAHHMNQLTIIKRLVEAGKKVAVGMEMFQIPYQKAIDDYLAGQTDERTFLKASAYFDKWWYDYNLYKPIIDYVKKNKLPMVALNIEGDISRKVARKGLGGLSEKEKGALPLEMDFSDSQYRQDLFRVFQMHQRQHSLKTSDFFLQSQTVWDETMAETVHRFVSFHPDTTLVVLAGNGHLRYKYGIPNRAFRRNGVLFTVIAQDEDFQPGIADYVIRTTTLNGKKSPLLGVGIQETNKGVSIVSVLDDSPAGKAGLEKGDIIVRMAGETIRSLVDLKYALFYTTSGSTVAIHVDRNGTAVSREVTLFDFKPHR